MVHVIISLRKAASKYLWQKCTTKYFCLEFHVNFTRVKRKGMQQIYNRTSNVTSTGNGLEHTRFCFWWKNRTNNMDKNVLNAYESEWQ